MLYALAEERTLRGSYIGSAVPARDIPRYIEMYCRGKLPVDQLMGEHLTLDERRKVNWDHPDAFDLDLLVTHLDQLAARGTRFASASTRALGTPRAFAVSRNAERAPSVAWVEIIATRSCP